MQVTINQIWNFDKKKSYSSGPVFLNGGKIFVKQVSNALKTINWRLYQTVSQSMTNEQTNSRSL